MKTNTSLLKRLAIKVRVWLSIMSTSIVNYGNQKIDEFIKWVENNAVSNTLVGSKNEVHTRRFHFLWPDEYWSESHGLVNARPWYAPFNVLLHNWFKSDSGLMHDHPRWSITIVLRGKLAEETPTKTKWLTPGSIVFRTHKSIHRIIIPKHYEGKVWTLFIVGRRRYKQSYYDLDGTPSKPIRPEIEKEHLARDKKEPTVT